MNSTAVSTAMRAVIWTAWKTASRIDDIIRLRPENVTQEGVHHDDLLREGNENISSLYCDSFGYVAMIVG